MGSPHGVQLRAFPTEPGFLFVERDFLLVQRGGAKLSLSVAPVASAVVRSGRTEFEAAWGEGVGARCAELDSGCSVRRRFLLGLCADSKGVTETEWCNGAFAAAIDGSSKSAVLKMSRIGCGHSLPIMVGARSLSRSIGPNVNRQVFWWGLVRESETRY